MQLFYINHVFVGIPIIAGILGFIEPSFWAIAALFPILTGIFQVTVGICLWNDSGFKNKYLTAYVGLTALFFLLWITTNWQWIWVMPPALATYLTVLIYIDTKKTKHVPQHP